MAEGNFKMAGMSLLAALTAVGSFLGAGICLGVKAPKYYNRATKTAKYIKNILKTIPYTGTFAFSAANLKHDVTGAIKEYKSTGRFSASSALNIIADGIGIAASGKALVSSGKNLRKMLKSDGVGAGIKTSLKESLLDNRGGINVPKRGANAIKGGSDVALKGEHTVYTLRDPIVDDIKYVGRTKNSIAREAAHKLTEGKESLVFTPEKTGLNYEQVRGAEQMLFDANGGLDKLLNKIRPISLKNPNYNKYMDGAKEIFK